MSAENIPTSQFPQEMVAGVIKELSAGKQPARIIKEMEKQGWTKDMAAALVAQAQQTIKTYQESPEGRKVMAARYKRTMLAGVLWAVGGIVVTAVTYDMASRGGGTYVVAWGAVIFGIYDFVRGLIGWLKNRS